MHSAKKKIRETSSVWNTKFLPVSDAKSCVQLSLNILECMVFHSSNYAGETFSKTR